MRSLVLLLLLFFCVACYHSQVDSVYTGSPSQSPPVKKVDPEKWAWKEKVTWGGNFQAWVGNPTFIFLSPTIGYTPIKNLNLGVGFIYNYTKVHNYYGSFAQSSLGGHSYVRYVMAQSYFVQVQYDKLHQPDLISLDPNDKTWVDYLLIGGGLRQLIGDKTAVTTSIMYNLLPSPLSIYPSRVIIQFGLSGNF